VARAYENLLDMIGNTPVVRLNHLPTNESGEVWAKLEYQNPGFSVKDRACLVMIEAAEADGRLKPGATIVEPTAGNTGVGLALVGLLKGYKVLCVMPEKFMGEKSTLVKAMGGEVLTTPTEKGMAYAMEVVQEKLKEIPGAITLGQFDNPDNPRSHRETTGPELLEQMDGKLDAICIGAGSGGTFTGMAQYFAEHSPDTLRVLVEPEGSIFAGGEVAPYAVEGIGGSFIPGTLELDLAQRIETIPDKETFQTVCDLARREGLLVGGSSGACAAAALHVARDLGPGKRIACLFPDAAERYLSKFRFEEV
jgi:cysteine synthase